MSVRRPGLVALLLLALLLLLAGCPEDQDSLARTQPGYSRVASVKAQRSQLQPVRWCDVYHQPATAPAFKLPSVVGETGQAVSSRLPGGQPSWVNLWATWCKPCIREMPLLGRFREVLASEGRSLQLVFLSLDEDQAELSAFVRANPRTLPTPSRRLRLADAAVGTGWLVPFGLKQEATIPIHLLLGPDGKLRCLRAGSVSDGDYRTIRSLLDGAR